MDGRMPKIGVIDAISAIRKEFPNARIVVLTMAAADVHALQTFRAAEVGYLLKNTLRTE
jgi:DNA-binding NarL/FixJ family response regulator